MKPVCVITGGGSGMGRATAKLVCEAGYHVILVGRTAAKLESAVAELTEAGHEAEAFACDLSDRASCEKLARHAVERGQVKALLHIAGMSPHMGSPEAILMAGIQDISNTLVEEFSLNDVLRIILETMYRAKGFKRVILCVREARSNTMLGRFGFGPDAPEISRRFNFSVAYTPDIFHAALSKGVDILISDTSDPKIIARIP